MTSGSTASALLPGARCAKHGERPATGVCGRCGDYLCGLCGRRVGDRLHCAGCAERSAMEHSRRAAQALVLGLCSVHGLFLLAPLSLSLSLRELSAIRAGEAPEGGRDLARAGLWLGALGLAMPLSAALVWIALR
jgi:hypothetical protein